MKQVSKFRLAILLGPLCVTFGLSFAFLQGARAATTSAAAPQASESPTQVNTISLFHKGRAGSC